MSLKKRIDDDFILAYKSKQIEKKNFLGVIKGAIQTQEGKNIESTDENILKVIKSIEKGILENIEARKKSSLDISEQELELSYIKEYQPISMTEDEIRTIVKELMSKIENKNQGILMGLFNKENQGKSFDNKIVSNIIKQELN